MKAAEELGATVADARFAKPLDEALIRQLLKDHELVVTVEEGSSGGFGAHVLEFAARAGLLSGKAKLLPLTLPDRFIEQNVPHTQYDEAGLNAAQIIQAVESRLGKAPVLVKNRG
jgi:1-deoxy-D-xylulose-5-phosphate synthase